MFIVIAIMFCGVAIGYFLRRKQAVKDWTGRLILPIVYTLLFVMGITIGSNDNIMGNLATLGFQALILTIGALIGSMIMALAVWKYFFKKTDTHEK